MDIPKLDDLKWIGVPTEIAECYFRDYPEGKWIGEFSYWINGVPVIYRSWRYFANKYPELVKNFDFDSYKEGFINGLKDFTEKPFLSIEDKKHQIFKNAFIIKGITYGFKEGEAYISPETAFLNGQNAGKLYYCWLQIIEYPEAFISKFKERKRSFERNKKPNKQRGEVSTISYFIDILSRTDFLRDQETDYKSYVKKICSLYGLHYSRRVENLRVNKEYAKYKNEILELAKSKLLESELIEFKEGLEQQINQVRKK